MQFLEGGPTGPNGLDSGTVRSAGQDPAGAGAEARDGRGSLMARYRNAAQPVPGAEDRTSPPLQRDGEAPAGPGSPTPPPAGSPVGAPGAPADSPWRQSSWTSAPPVPPVPPAPPAPAPPAAPAGSATVTDKPAEKPADRTADQPAAERPTDETQAAKHDKPVEAPKPDAPKPDGPKDATPAKPADKPAVTVNRGTAPGPTALGPTAAGPTAARVGLLSDGRTAEFTQRWRDLQGDFVDDPQQAVRGAGELSKEILQALADTIADAERVDNWKAEDGTSGTEDLRVALRQYRTLVDRLLEL